MTTFSPAPPPQPVQKVTPVAPPPDEFPLVQAVIAILLAGYVASKTLDLIAAALKPYGITRQAVSAALGLATTAHAARPELKTHGFARRSASADIVRAAASRDVAYRAAYVVKAAGRMQQVLDDGGNLGDALRKEAANFEAHRAARRKRLDAAAATASNAEMFGPLLGWYRNHMLDSDIDCRVADGHNFYASTGTVIGYPGSVHPNCGCTSGPPHEQGGIVDDVLGSVLGRMGTSRAQREVLRLRTRHTG